MPSSKRARFDKSNYPKNHPSGIETDVNKKVIGMFKDEAGGKLIKEFVGLTAKPYSFITDKGEEEKKCEGIKKPVIKRLTFQDYKNSLFNNEEKRTLMNVIRSYLHMIYTETVNKIGLSPKDDKRIICKDGIHTLAIGHFKTKSGGSSVSSGTN